MKLSRHVINERSVGEHPVTSEGWHAFYLTWRLKPMRS
jgi:hypothetical protein